MTSTASFIVAANRLPVERRGDSWRVSPGGLVTALTPILAEHHGTWIGWAGTPGDAPEPFTTDSGISLAPIALDEDDYAEFYEGFSNATLWPLFHDLIVPPVYNAQWWKRFVTVNRRFAEKIARLAAPGATVWVQDYQLHLVPGMVKELRPDVTVGFFLHIPFPSPDLIAQLPWREELIGGLARADLVGFHTQRSARNFEDAALRFAGAKPTTVALPISIDTPKITSMAQPGTIREKLGNPEHFLLGVDRLDYTKGILPRLLAVEKCFERGILDPATTTFVQIATPSRERVEHYEKTRAEVERHVSRINGLYGGLFRSVVVYVHRTVDASTLYHLYAAADTMLVTPFKDGMNLVAKEYVACHPDGSGALVLSEFAGAAEELTKAYICNPFDVEAIAQAIAAAVSGEGDPRGRMLSMYQRVYAYDVHRWANDFLSALRGARAC